MATFAYLRVSRRDQTVENQRLEIEKAGYKVDYWYADEGVSGSSAAAQRPQFQELLKQIRDGEQLVVSRIDRLGRDAQDALVTLKALARRKVGVIVLQLGKVDLTSPPGKMLVTMLAAVAEMERDLLIERTAAGLERAKAEGKVLGRPARLSPKDRKAVIELRHGGMSISGLSRHFGVSRQTISRVLDAAAGSPAPQEAAAAPAPQPAVDAAPKARKRASKATEKPVAAPDVKLRAALEKKGQRRLPAV
jgi:putative DNA-invertase from lambdoid prophage Rac